MSKVTLSQKQVINLRSGQTVYYVWGAFEKYTNKMKLHVSGGWLTGKRSHIKHNGWHDKQYRSFTVKSKVFEKYYLNQHLITSIGGGMDERFFTKKKHAEKFMAEIYAGYHPWAVANLREHHANCDLVDEALADWSSMVTDSI